MQHEDKSRGVTATERTLTDFCERTFLKLWSYANPHKDDGHEMCDLIAVFGNDVFIFFDREILLDKSEEKDPDVIWDRWKRKVVDKQVNTAHGAERYIRMGRPCFLDSKNEQPFPIQIDPGNSRIHKIIVAHGAKEACKNASSRNIYGSLAISYQKVEGANTSDFPFHVIIDRSKPVHILDSHNLSIVLTELDTVSDFVNYLEEKIRAIERFETISYCGEEDLLGHYLANFDSTKNRHVIGPRDDLNVNYLMIGEGEWRDFIKSEIYKSTKIANKVSYHWDELIQRTCQNALDGVLGGNSNLLHGQSAIYEMVKEPRFVRRGLFEKILEVVQNFPDQPEFARQVTLLPSYVKDTTYVFLQIRSPRNLASQADYREKRLKILEIACGSAKNKFPALAKIIGIGIDSPKFSRTNGEDFILMPCDKWSDELRTYYEKANEHWKFFATPQMRKFEHTVSEFVSHGTRDTPRRPQKIGRNEPCPCGSGKKYKKCHGGASLS